jgi:hypothetical protein
MLSLLATQGALAQPVSFGLKGGVPLADAVGGNFGGSSEARQYTVGLMVELRLPASFAFEADGLYKRTGYRASQSDSGVTIIGRVRALSWEFPLLLRYYLPLAPLARPFVGGGYVIRHLSGVKGSAHITGTTSGGTRIDTTLSVPASTVIRKDPTHGSLSEPACASEQDGSMWLLRYGTRAGVGVRSTIRDRGGSSCNLRRIRWSCWSA